MNEQKTSNEWPWRELLSSQGRFLRELWQVGTSSVKDPRSWPSKASQFWSHWASPDAWFSGGRGVPDSPGEACYFVIDGAAEATGERRLRLPFTLGSTALETTSLKNIQGRGEIAAEHVEARLIAGPTGDELGLALVNLGRVQPRLTTGEIDPGLYVGAIFADGDRSKPLVIVQARLAPRG
jgi:hypothetical protein